MTDLILTNHVGSTAIKTFNTLTGAGVSTVTGNGSGGQNGVVASGIAYWGGASGGVQTWNFSTATLGSISLPLGDCVGVCKWGSLLYFSAINGSNLAIYSYDPSSSTLTLLRASVTGSTSHSNNALACDGVNVYTQDTIGTNIYKTVISSGALSTFAYGTTYYSIFSFVLDPTGTYLYLTHDQNGYQILVRSMNTSTWTNNTVVTAGNGNRTWLTFDASGNLWFAQDGSTSLTTVVGYYTTLPTFIGTTTVTVSSTYTTTGIFYDQAGGRVFASFNNVGYFSGFATVTIAGLTGSAINTGFGTNDFPNLCLQYNTTTPATAQIVMIV